MSTRAATYEAVVTRREPLSDHLVRLELGGSGLAGFLSTGIPDEWVALVAPGQFQSRYYTVRSWDPDSSVMTLDVVVHDVGLVTEWVRTDCVGQTCVISDPKGSFAMPEDAAWLMLMGDLTALPAMARIAASVDVPVHAWAEVPDVDELVDYLAPLDGVHWLQQPADGASSLADAVSTIDWPAGDGYFWMAGESAQMRAIRKYLMRERRLPSTAYDVMGYWRGVTARQPRAVDPGPIWRAGKAAGKTDEQIWADYDEARDS